MKKVVISLPDDVYKTIKENRYSLHTGCIYDAIRQGTLVETGHWIDDCPVMTDEGLVRRIRCSVCGDGRKDFYGVSKNYCPKCGNPMEEGGINGTR